MFKVNNINSKTWCEIRLKLTIKTPERVYKEIDKQIDILCSKLSRANGILSKLRRFAPLKTCLSVYDSIFYSHLFHGCLPWSYTKEINIYRVDKLQKC